MTARRVVVVYSSCDHGHIGPHFTDSSESIESLCKGGPHRRLSEGEFVLVEKVDGEWDGWVVKSDPKTWRYCPICGRRNRAAASLPDLIDEMGETLADWTFCSPSNCDAWKVTATFDHDTREWIPVDTDVLAVGEGS